MKIKVSELIGPALNWAVENATMSQLTRDGESEIDPDHGNWDGKPCFVCGIFNGQGHILYGFETEQDRRDSWNEYLATLQQGPSFTGSLEVYFTMGEYEYEHGYKGAINEIGSGFSLGTFDGTTLTWNPKVEFYELPQNYSEDWSIMEPIIQREEIRLNPDNESDNVFVAWIGAPLRHEAKALGYGNTKLLAACRCYVAATYGEEVEVPDGLLDINVINKCIERKQRMIEGTASRSLHLDFTKLVLDEELPF